MRLIGLRCGGLLVDIGSFYGSSPSGSRDEVPVMCFVVDTGDGVLVFDTGMHEACCDERALARYGRMLESFEPVCPREALIDARLRQAGFAIDEIRWVTNSHLHFDHAGSNACFGSATHLVRARELAFARTRMQKPFGFIAAEIEWLTSVSDTWDYDETFVVADGVVLADASGHTPGHQTLSIDFPDGRRFVCIGDAAYSLEAVDTLTPTGFVSDRPRSVATLQALRDARDGGSVLLSAHDRDQWHGVTDLVLIHEG